MGRPKAWELHKPYPPERKTAHKQAQREAVLTTFRQYNAQAPVVQNLDFGHTDPQIPMPYGGKVRLNSSQHRIWATF